MAPAVLSFFAPGVPSTQGSARAFVVKGRAVVTHDNKSLRSWRSVVSDSARQAGAVLLEGAVGIHMTFRSHRPKGHYGTGKNAEVLRDTAPPYPATKSSKDWDKLARAVCDALTAIAYVDDAQIVHAVVKKRWCLPHQQGGVFVSVYSVPSGLALRESVDEDKKA